MIMIVNRVRNATVFDSVRSGLRRNITLNKLISVAYRNNRLYPLKHYRYKLNISKISGAMMQINMKGVAETGIIKHGCCRSGYISMKRAAAGAHQHERQLRRRFTVWTYGCGRHGRSGGRRQRFYSHGNFGWSFADILTGTPATAMN